MLFMNLKELLLKKKLKENKVDLIVKIYVLKGSYYLKVNVRNKKRTN